MSAISKLEAFKAEEHSIEECLTEMQKYGNPVLRKSDRGWSSNISVFVNGEGVEFKVDSDFGMPTAKEAINQCCHRLMKAISGIQGY